MMDLRVEIDILVIICHFTQIGMEIDVEGRLTFVAGF